MVENPIIAVSEYELPLLYKHVGLSLQDSLNNYADFAIQRYKKLEHVLPLLA